MKHNKVGSVMTTEVVRATYGTPFKEVARLLGEHRISGLPVVDEDEKVVGVVSETDLMAHQAETPDPYEPKKRFRFADLTRSGKRRAAKATARTAGRLMTAPPVTVHAEDTIVEAARTMAQHRVERLPVLDEEDRLVGIVTRRDVLQVFLRPDADIRDEVVAEVLVRALWLAPSIIDVSVVEGVVTLSGQMERKSETEIAVSMTRQIDGVVAVVDQLSYRRDDSHIQPEEQTYRGVTETWVRHL
ncbi:CBS domain-containing protein [Streptomyces sp. NBC_01478]|uniref:CBS domain-containing protein n=1 Tax=Streptomyces sp. NBC_01478 TaxID=2903882 RepID=UPI002E3032B6|nr:CBS domain-containing protein [Streptomyces sp. NBC_01478]